MTTLALPPCLPPAPVDLRALPAQPPPAAQGGAGDAFDRELEQAGLDARGAEAPPAEPTSAAEGGPTAVEGEEPAQEEDDAEAPAAATTADPLLALLLPPPPTALTAPASPAGAASATPAPTAGPGATAATHDPTVSTAPEAAADAPATPAGAPAPAAAGEPTAPPGAVEPAPVAASAGDGARHDGARRGSTPPAPDARPQDPTTGRPGPSTGPAEREAAVGVEAALDAVREPAEASPAGAGAEAGVTQVAPPLPAPPALVAAPAATAAPAMAAAPVASPDLAEQVRFLITPTVSEARIELAPADLGAMSVRLVLQDGALAARLEAATPAGRLLLERHRGDLEAALAADGVSARVEVAPVERAGEAAALGTRHAPPQDVGARTPHAEADGRGPHAGGGGHFGERASAHDPQERPTPGLGAPGRPSPAPRPGRRAAPASPHRLDTLA